ncbi:MAG: ABC transporter ATP-binding protein/permease, partial [Coriobacteriia bacterium]|nr:ABC transporter ATP-binding protein/permease [Coriobacteriia bacterium]
VEAGTSLAVIGPTGSGKSTLCWLLLRFYDAQSGSIRLGGHDLGALAADQVRAHVAIVPQKPMLFSGTVSSNIRWGRPQASPAEVRQAAGQAEAASFIEQMPEGYESLLGAGAVNISGGQKQRISIARGIIKQAPILVLDDATSALDSITESKIRAHLLARSAGATAPVASAAASTDPAPAAATAAHAAVAAAPPVATDNPTVILVTQRCTTAMFADQILVLDNGRSVGLGTHDSLMQDCPTYREIYRSQVDSAVAAWGNQEVGGNDA